MGQCAGLSCCHRQQVSLDDRSMVDLGVWSSPGKNGQTGAKKLVFKHEVLV